MIECGPTTTKVSPFYDCVWWDRTEIKKKIKIEQKDGSGASSMVFIAHKTLVKSKGFRAMHFTTRKTTKETKRNLLHRGNVRGQVD